MVIGIYNIEDTQVSGGITLNCIQSIANNGIVKLFDVNDMFSCKYKEVLNIIFTSEEFNSNLHSGRLIFTLDGVTQDISFFYSWIQTELVEYLNNESKIIIKGTTVFDFGSEMDDAINTILDSNIKKNLSNINIIPIETNETSLEDFNLNKVVFNIENIICNTSFDIRARALNNASGNYKIQYIITI